jgi:hypothetical protein
MLSTILIIVLVLLLIGALPQLGWHSQGYLPGGGIGILLVIVIILVLMGKI